MILHCDEYVRMIKSSYSNRRHQLCERFFFYRSLRPCLSAWPVPERPRQRVAPPTPRRQTIHRVWWWMASSGHRHTHVVIREKSRTVRRFCAQRDTSAAETTRVESFALAAQTRRGGAPSDHGSQTLALTAPRKPTAYVTVQHAATTITYTSSGANQPSATVRMWPAASSHGVAASGTVLKDKPASWGSANSSHEGAPWRY